MKKKIINKSSFDFSNESLNKLNEEELAKTEGGLCVCNNHFYVVGGGGYCLCNANAFLQI